MATQTEWVGLAVLGGIAVLLLTKRPTSTSSSGSGITAQQHQALQAQNQALEQQSQSQQQIASSTSSTQLQQLQPVSGAYTTPVTKTSIPYQYNPSIPSVVSSSGQTIPVASSATLNGVRVSVFNEGDVTQPGSSASALYQYALSNPQFVRGQLAASQATGQINSAVLQAAQTLGLVSTS